MDKKRTTKILSYLKRNKKSPRKMLQTCWTEELNNKKMLCFTNGYTGFMLYEISEDLPINHDYKTDFIIKMILDVEAHAYSMNLTPINLNDLKSKLKNHDQKYKGVKYVDGKPKCYIDIGEHRYNVKYLIECIEILGGKDIQFYQPDNGKLTSSMFISEYGKALIMPVRK